ncbi:glycoside hydrolase family 5 protein [Hypholoma sublateritium FD-334 SS-4]|uniref:cellulase n=2 Tax=Hypholoma TaxID=71944 RepID=A0A0D2KY46_HYPSF|nr:glycoside hydrolase family 5 protein [Hypholoma sublateritium FD-334 SS-4]
MKSLLAFSSLAILFIKPAFAQVAIYGQCGGVNYSGATTCASGSTCVYSNPYYSQCLPGQAPSSSTTVTASPTTTTVKTTTTGTTTTTASSPGNSVCPGTRTKFKFFGVNESGAEFGNTAWPGALGTDYTWPSPSSIDFFVGKGFNTFRVPFLLERMTPPATGITGPFNQTYLSGLQTIVSYITGKGAFVLIEPHNYMSYNNAVITSNSDFQTFWKNLATVFKSNNNVIFDLMNEPNGIPATTVAALMQSGINGVRSAGATTQMILVEGTSWTGAWTWTSSGNAAAFTGLTDPNNNFAIEMHQYLDSDGSGTSATCVSSSIGSSRLADATTWLQANNIKGFLGEIGAGNNTVCIQAIQGALCSMQQASGAWLGALWWAAGPWWGDYFQSIEPPSGPAVAQVLPQALMPFL